MSTYRTNLSNSNHRFFLANAVMTLVLGVTVAFGSDHSPCSDAISVDLDSTARFSSGEEASIIFAVEPVAEGLLSVHALAPLGSRAEPRLRFLGGTCDQISASTPRGYVAGEEVHIPAPGTYYFQVSSQNPAIPLGNFKLMTGFSGDEDDGGLDVKDGGGEGETEPVEVDETIPVVFECPTSLPAATKDGGGEGETEPVEVDETIPAFSGCLNGPSLSHYMEICRSREMDDVADVLACAALVVPGSTTSGEIRNDWRDDQDVFAMFVEGWRTLHVEAKGNFELLGAVYDRRGQRMASSRPHDGGTSLSVVRTFAPGIYFIRIDGRNNDEGSYSLSIEEVSW